MSRFRLLAPLCVVWSGGLLLAACNDSAPETTPANAGAKPAAVAPPNPVENMVAAVPAGRSARSLGVHFTLGNSPTVQQALPVDIAVLPHDTFTSLRARFDSQNGLTLISGDQLPPRKDIAAEKPIKHQLVMMPTQEGVYMITASIETEGVEGTVSRIFSIPVIVSAAPPAPAATVDTPEPPVAGTPATN